MNMSSIQLTENEKNIILALRRISEKGNDVELRNKSDGTYKVFEVERKKLVG